MTPAPDAVERFTDRELLIEIRANLNNLVLDKKDHEERLRVHDTRLNKVEASLEKAVTGKQLWTGFLSAVGVAGPITGFIVWLVTGR